MSATRTLREILARGGLLVAPGVFDGLSARIVEAAGFGERDDLVDLSGWQARGNRYRTP